MFGDLPDAVGMTLCGVGDADSDAACGVAARDASVSVGVLVGRGKAIALLRDCERRWHRVVSWYWRAEGLSIEYKCVPLVKMMSVVCRTTSFAIRDVLTLGWMSGVRSFDGDARCWEF
jgi:hypothetical protein